MWEFMVLLLLVAVLVVFLAPRFIRPGPRGALASGTLLVTGVSPRPDDISAQGEQFATISGVINGPTVNEHAVYRRMVVDVDQWPVTGQQFPVVYSPNNPDNWNFAPPEPAEPPEPAD
ncbi:hypothetical protein AO501_12665 [Mycobacterium gordonae]|uniref:Uncharacterized protein n=1 Tax=Mycobacterium gordonae TaxID=1778 RepID=A0A0Q2RPB4_MYCGO|nr:MULTISPECIES: hypothetical protein [Mycobacterium]KQH77195.1 hypothetical protein AO501_12665 [Mycobacterium gordonae]MDP7729731.1 hypothetical protein [Mycobacterium sp. TY813]